MARLASITNAEDDPITDEIVVALIGNKAGFVVVKPIQADEGVWLVSMTEPVDAEHDWLIFAESAYLCVAVADDLFEVNISTYETF